MEWRKTCSEHGVLPLLVGERVEVRGFPDYVEGRNPLTPAVSPPPQAESKLTTNRLAT
jgi:hypothetical protein